MKSGLSLLLLNLLSAAFYIGVVIAAMKVICVIFGKGKTPGPVKIKRNETITITKEQYIKVILLTAGIWISIIGVSYLCTVYKKNSIISLSDFLNIFTTRWDSNSFREIAAKGYQIGTDRDVLMVFLPFYPLLIRAFSYIFGNVETSSIIISLFCAVGSVIYLYKLMRVDYDEETSFRAVKYYLLFPTAFFLLTPMSESIFMLLVLAAFYYIRRHKWSVASVIAFAASFTRLQGCLLMFPMIVEMFLELDEKGGGKVKDKLLGVLKKSYYIVLSFFGIIIYMFYNLIMKGDPLYFIKAQAHWNNSLTSIFKSMEVLNNSILHSTNINLLIGVGVSGVIGFVAGVAALFYGIFKLRSTYIAYHAPYVLISESTGWPLSGCRYMLAAFPIFMSTALIGKNKLLDNIFTIISSMLLVMFAFMYVEGSALY